MKRSIIKRYHQADSRLNVIKCQSAINVQKGDLSTKHLRYRGIAFVWTALVIFAIFLFVGLSIDWAKLMYNLHELQNAADSAALAGAQIVKVSTAEETRLWTQELASDNTAERLDVYLRTTAQADPFTNYDDLDIILGRWINNQHYFFPTLDAPDAVMVIARREEGLTDAPALALLYGPLVKVTKADAHRVAIGWYNLASGAGLIVLHRQPLDKQGNPTPGLLIADNVGSIKVIGGSIQVNTIYEGTKENNNPPAALYVKAGGTLLSSRLTVTGHTDPEPATEDDLNGWDNIWFDDTLAVPMEMPYDIWEGAPYMPDPLGPQGANIQPPVISEYPVRSYTKNTSVTLEPGYYPDGIEMTADGVVVNLQPGTYILGGGSNDISQDSGLIQTGGTLIGHGVLIYLTKDYGNDLVESSDDGRWAQLDIGGNVVTDITPPGDESNPKVIDGLDGVSIWQDRLNTANQAQLHGGGGMMISGTLYFPENHVYLAGNPGKAGNQLLCGSVEVFGRAQILVQYDGRNNLSKGVSVLVK